MMNILAIFMMAFMCLASNAKDFIMEFQFSPTKKLSGQMHDRLLIIRDEGRIIVCRARPADVKERNWLAEYPKESSSAFYTESVAIDGIGKAIMLICEHCLLGGEECIRGIAYLIDKDGKWEQGVFSKRTLGWSGKTNDIWGGYEFVQKRKAARR